MAQTYNKLNIEINQKVTDIITAVQDDTNSRYLDVQLFDNGTPINLTGQEVRIFLKKPDGTNIWNDGEVTSATEGRCQFLLTTQTLAVCGVLETQISIWQNNEEILSTEIFKIFVTKSLRSSGSIESSNEYGSLVVLFQNIYEALDLMTEMVQSFGAAGAVAQGIPVTTFWQMLEAVYTVNAEALANASVSEVLNRMGLTNDSGATATTGTLMGKTNWLIDKANEEPRLIASLLGDEDYTSYYNYINRAGTSGSWLTLCEINGEGYLSGAVLGLIATSNTSNLLRAKMTIDGVNVLNYERSYNGSSNSGESIGLVNKNYLVFGSENAYFFGKNIEPIYIKPYIRGVDISTPRNQQSNNFLSASEIKFNEQLKIEVNVTGAYANTVQASYLYHIKNN